MRLQRSLKRRRFRMRECESPEVELGVGALGNSWPRFGPGSGFRPRLQFNCGAQLADRGNTGQLRIVPVGSLARALRDHTNLVQREAALPHSLRTAGQRLESVTHT